MFSLCPLFLKSELATWGVLCRADLGSEQGINVQKLSDPLRMYVSR